MADEWTDTLCLAGGRRYGCAGLDADGLEASAPLLTREDGCRQQEQQKRKPCGMKVKSEVAGGAYQVAKRLERTWWAKRRGLEVECCCW